MSICQPGSLVQILPPSGTDDCACDCTMGDITWNGSDLSCISTSTGDSLTTIILNINDEICDLQAEINPTDISYCTPNATPPIAPTGTIVDHVEFIASQLIPKSGNDCDCPITDKLWFTDTKGIYQCGAGQNDGYVQFSGNYTNINGENQVRVLSDLKVTNGISAGYTEITATTDLSILAPDALNYSYGIDASGGNITLGLPEIGNATLDNKNRRFSTRRLDCDTTKTVTIQAAAGETIEGAASITLPVGHSYIIHADDTSEDWVIVAEYYGCAMNAQNDGDIYITYNLGIGDSSPDSKLDVVTTDTAQTVAIFENTGAASVDLVEIKRNGSVIDVFDSAGNAGFGVAVPLARAHAKLPAATGGTDNVILGTTSTGTTIFQAAIDASSCFAVVGNTGFGDNSVRINGNATPTTFNGVVIQNSATDVYAIGQKPNDNLTISATSSFTGGIEIVKTTGAIYLNEKIKKYNAAAPTDGQLLIGDTAGAEFDAATITEGRAVTVTNGAGSITLKQKNTVSSTVVSMTLDSTHYVVICDTTAGDITLQLPTAASANGWEYTIKKTIVANSVVIQCAGAETLDGSNSKTIANQYASRTIVSDGSAWHIISLI